MWEIGKPLKGNSRTHHSSLIAKFKEYDLFTHSVNLLNSLAR